MTLSQALLETANCLDMYRMHRNSEFRDRQLAAIRQKLEFECLSVLKKAEARKRPASTKMVVGLTTGQARRRLKGLNL